MNWHDAVKRILESDSIDLKVMADAAGVSAKHLYRGQNLTGVDLKGQDLRELDLEGSDLSGSILDKHTIIDPKFDPRSQPGFVRRSIRISRNLFICVRVFESDIGYVYTGWAIKWLLHQAFLVSTNKAKSKEWLSWLESSKSARNVINQPGGQDYSLKVPSLYYDNLVDIYGHTGGNYKAMKFSILVGILSYWNVTPDYIANESILRILQKVQKQPSTDALLLSLARSWTEPE